MLVSEGERAASEREFTYAKDCADAALKLEPHAEEAQKLLAKIKRMKRTRR